MSLRDTTDDESRPFSRESAMALRATADDENRLFSGQSAIFEGGCSGRTDRPAPAPFTV
jgi:hypothetical protein